jgi:hypothetical protein
LEDALISVGDELGADYRVISTGGGGTGSAWKGEANIIPTPAFGLARFRVDIEAFEGFGAGLPGVARTPRTDGPWVFANSLSVAAEHRDESPVTLQQKSVQADRVCRTAHSTTDQSRAPVSKPPFDQLVEPGSLPSRSASTPSEGVHLRKLSGARAGAET